MRHRYRGVTLIELMITLGILFLTLTVGVSGYTSLRKNHFLQDAASILYSDIQYTRSEAFKRHTEIWIRFFGINTPHWCYRISDRSDSHCNSCSALCDLGGDGVIRGRSATDYPHIDLQSARFFPVSGRLGVEPIRGISSNGTVTFAYDGSPRHIAVITSRLGRSRICTPLGAEAIIGVSTC